MMSAYLDDVKRLHELFKSETSDPILERIESYTEGRPRTRMHATSILHLRSDGEMWRELRAESWHGGMPELVSSAWLPSPEKQSERLGLSRNYWVLRIEQLESEFDAADPKADRGAVKTARQRLAEVEKAIPAALAAEQAAADQEHAAACERNAKIAEQQRAWRQTYEDEERELDAVREKYAAMRRDM